MRIDILTSVPKILIGPFSESIIKRAIEKDIINIYIHDLHDYGLGKNKKIDDYSYGGGPGMILRIEPIYKCLKKLFSTIKYDDVIFMTPDGIPFTQKEANILSYKKNLIIICGRYKGIDYRIRENFITKEISIGKYVITGGELAAAVLIDATVRMIPGVLGNYNSALTDSFQKNSFQEILLEPPIYTRPYIYNNWKVPKILLSGNLKKIEEWKNIKSYERIKNIKY